MTQAKHRKEVAFPLPDDRHYVLLDDTIYECPCDPFLALRCLSETIKKSGKKRVTLEIRDMKHFTRRDLLRPRTKILLLTYQPGWFPAWLVLSVLGEDFDVEIWGRKGRNRLRYVLDKK